MELAGVFFVTCWQISVCSLRWEVVRPGVTAWCLLLCPWDLRKWSGACLLCLCQAGMLSPVTGECLSLRVSCGCVKGLWLANLHLASSSPRFAAFRVA